ncbi:DUF3761 domain-containing protein [Streptomyces sp. NPDC007148]|uniref:DUF3761 domain-containing protein n=1 Tax=Streptomyces sp. NPDC007148 TaxID=3364775 RepID=UPI0036ACCE4A
MNRTVTTAAAAVVLAGALTACSSATTTSSSNKPKASPTYAAGSFEARCHAERWPQTMPQLAGKTFNPLSEDLQCFDHVKALAPDGHDVMKDSANDAQEWTIVSSKPANGAQVRISTAITLTLRAPGETASPTPSHTRSVTATKPPTRNPAPVHTTHRPAAPHTTAPAVDDHGGATALCNDGSLSYSQHHQGTCSHHHGVAVWYK